MTPAETELIVRLSEGNIGAAVALGEVCKVHDAVDPYCAGGAFIVLYQMMDLGLRGPNIHVLFKDVCGCDGARLVMLLRAWQLGFVTADTLRLASVRRGGAEVDTNSLWDLVSAELPRFQKRPQ